MNAIEGRMMTDVIMERMVDPETGVLLSEDEALKLAETYEAEVLDKCEWFLKRINEEKYKVEAMKNQYKVLGNMIKTKENQIDRLSKYVAMALNYEKWETPDGLAKISYRTTKDTVKVDNIDEIPLAYFKTPRYESNLSKTMIKEAIQDGITLPGVHLEDSKSIIIKG